MERNKITYLIGAGASANALPMIRPSAIHLGYIDSLREMAKELSEKDRMISLSDCHQFAKDLNWLADNAEQYGSPDTYVKYLSLKGDDINVAKVKRTLSVYFTIEQFINKKKDSRYLKFLTKIIERNHLFPENIKILNWNYDFQFQIAAEIFTEEKFFHKNSVTRHSPPLISYYPTLGHDFNVNHDTEKIDLSLVHLNGIAGFYFYQQNNFVLSYFMNNSITTLDDLFEICTRELHLKATLLTFAFDTQQHMNTAIRNRFSFANAIIRNSDYLVIIGYSFPIDNIQYDEQLFATIKSPSLKEIFYQDPYNNGGFLRNLFEIDDRIKITHIEDVQEFFIPRQFKLAKKSSS
jgi:hypothetical protein